MEEEIFENLPVIRVMIEMPYGVWKREHIQREPVLRASNVNFKHQKEYIIVPQLSSIDQVATIFRLLGLEHKDNCHPLVEFPLSCMAQDAYLLILLPTGSVAIFTVCHHTFPTLCHLAPSIDGFFRPLGTCNPNWRCSIELTLT